LDAQEVRHIALGAAIDIWGDDAISVHGLLHLASTLEDYLINGYDSTGSKVPTPAPVVTQSAASVDPSPIVNTDPKA